MLAVILAAVLGASAPNGTVYTAEGGRVRGELVEAGPAGVAVKLPDGSTRRFAPAEVSKVVLADGTVWRPGDPPPAVAPAAAGAAAGASPAASPVPGPAEAEPGPASAPVGAVGAAAIPAPAPMTALTPAAAMLIPAERLDTLFLVGGGRLRALVTEETPEAVVVRLVDGAERRFEAGKVERIVYTDGTVSILTPPAATPAAPPAVPKAVPQPVPPAPSPAAPQTVPPAASPAAPPAAPVAM